MFSRLLAASGAVCARRAPWVSTRSVTVRALSTAGAEVAAGSDDVYDVVIVGGGVVGATLACKIASSTALQGRRIALIEPRQPSLEPPVGPEDGVDLRVFAITPASTEVFTDLGVWDAMTSYRAAPYADMQVWDACGNGHVRFDASMTGGSYLGHIVENRVLAACLWQRLLELQDAGSLEILTPSSVASLQAPRPASAPRVKQASADSVRESNSLVNMTLDCGRDITAQLVVASDGAQSAVRRFCNVGNWGWDYDQRGVVCVIRTEEAHATAWQRFLPDGPVAILPLWDNLSSIVWSTTPEHAAELQKLDEADFVAELNAAFTEDPPSVAESDGFSHVLSLLPRLAEPVLGAVEKAVSAAGASRPSERLEPPHVVGVAGPRASFPFRFSHTNKLVIPRVAFIGDAAHTVHPLAGQGMNLGIADASALAETLIKGAEVGQDLGSLGLLRQFDAARTPHNVSMMLGMDAIKRVFAGGPGPWADLRNLGMRAVNAATPIKDGLAHFASRSSPLNKRS